MTCTFFFYPVAQQSESSTPDKGRSDEQEHVTVARALHKFLMKAKLARVPFPINFSSPHPRPSSTHQITTTTSKILPLICPRTASRSRPVSPLCLRTTAQSRPMNAALNETSLSSKTGQPEKFPAASAAPYIPVRHFSPHHRIAPPVTIRNAIPVFSAPPIPPPSQSPRVIRPATLGVAPSVSIRHVVPVYAAPPPPVRAEELPVVDRQPQQKEPPSSKAPPVWNEAAEIQVHLEPSKPAPGRAEEPPLSRTSQIQVETPPSHQVLPQKVEEPMLSETLPSQVDPQLPKISTDPEPAPCQSNEQIAVKDKPQESLEIENFKQLEI